MSFRPSLTLFEVALLQFQPQRGVNMPAQGNALGWRVSRIMKP